MRLDLELVLTEPVIGVHNASLSSELQRDLEVTVTGISNDYSDLELVVNRYCTSRSLCSQFSSVF